MWLLGTLLSVFGYMSIQHYLALYSTNVEVNKTLAVNMAKSRASLFHAYSEAVFNFAISNPGASFAPLSALYQSGLPVGSNIPSSFRNAITDSNGAITVWVWATPESGWSGNPSGWVQTGGHLTKISGGSYIEGMNKNGVLILPASYYANLVYGAGSTTAIAVPSFIPSGSLVAVMNP